MPAVGKLLLTPPTIVLLSMSEGAHIMAKAVAERDERLSFSAPSVAS